MTNLWMTLIAFFFLTNAAMASGFQAQTDQDANTGYIRYLFNGEPSVRIAPAGNAAANEGCTAHKKGGLRYNTYINKMEYCNGVNWIVMGEAEAKCPAGHVLTTAADGSDLCLNPVCPKGEMLTKDSDGKFACTSIFANADCVVERKSKTSTEMITHTCSAGRYAVSGSCWRINGGDMSENWMSGLFVGDALSTDRHAYTCRIENGSRSGYGLQVWVNCCR